MTTVENRPETCTASDSDADCRWREYLKSGADEAFTEVVRRHIDLVYSVAFRRCGPNAALAEEVTQLVFVDLIRKAGQLPKEIVLAGWLYRHAGFVAASMVRAETRRRRREEIAMELHDLNTTAGSDWLRLAPVLDEAMDELPERDRDAVVLRYLDQRSFAAIGRRLGLSADAARMRADRALDRLRGLLARRGVDSTAAALALAISQHGVMAAPGGLAASVATVAMQGAVCGAAVATSTLVNPATLGLMASTPFKLGAVAVVAAGAIATAWYEHGVRQRLAAELSAVQAELTQQRDTVSVAVSDAEVEQLRQDRARLMALRDEVSRLREAQRNLTRLEEENRTLRAAASSSKSKDANATDSKEERNIVEESQQGLILARLNYVKAWGLAAILFTEGNGGMMPRSFAEASGHFPPEWASLMSVFDPNRFEIVYQGSLREVPHPARTIIIRERESFSRTTGDPQADRPMRSYVFADGHSEVHASATGDFEAWERERMIQPQE